MENADIAKIFHEIANLLEIKGENPFKVRSYRAAREPYPVNMKKIMEAAKRNNVVMELNAYPDRLDLNDIHCRLAKEMGVMVAISTDPPTQTSREPEYSYSVSAPLPITTLDSINPQ